MEEGKIVVPIWSILLGTLTTEVIQSDEKKEQIKDELIQIEKNDNL